MQLVAGTVWGTMFLYPLRDGSENFLAIGFYGFVVEEGPLRMKPDVFDLVAAFQLGDPFPDGGLVLNDDLELMGIR